MKPLLFILPALTCASLGTSRASAQADMRAGGRVILYEQAGYQGQSIELAPGDEIADFADLRYRNGARANDSVSSIRIEPGASVTVGMHAGLGGETARFDASVPNLAAIPAASGGSWNDRISSARAHAAGRGRSPGGGGEREPRIIVYRDANFRGASYEVFPGEVYDDLDRVRFEGWPAANDEISSIRVVGAVSARVGSDRNFRGGTLEITRDMANLGTIARGPGANWNDVISSLEVRRASVIDDPRPGRPGRGEVEAVIRAVFAELLGRAPTPAELRAYQTRFERERWSERDLRDDIQRSREYRVRQAEAIIQRCYRELLGRDPDPEGLEAYRRAILEQGWDEARLREDIRRSEEYRNRLIPKPIRVPSERPRGKGDEAKEQTGEEPAEEK